MYENIYVKTPPRFGENAGTLPLDIDRPCFIIDRPPKLPPLTVLWPGH